MSEFFYLFPPGPKVLRSPFHCWWIFRTIWGPVVLDSLLAAGILCDGPSLWVAAKSLSSAIGRGAKWSVPAGRWAEGLPPRHEPARLNLPRNALSRPRQPQLLCTVPSPSLESYPVHQNAHFGARDLPNHLPVHENGPFGARDPRNHLPVHQNRPFGARDLPNFLPIPEIPSLGVHQRPPAHTDRLQGVLGVHQRPPAHTKRLRTLLLFESGGPSVILSP